MITAHDKTRWEQIGRLELNMRRLVADILSERFGAEAWERGIPNDVRARIVDNFKEHQQRDAKLIDSMEERLEECDLGGLYEIIKMTWKSLFTSFFEDNRAVFDMQSDVINRMRNCLDHYRRDVLPTGEDDPTLRPNFDTFLPLQFRLVLRGLASRGLTCVEVVDEKGQGIEREDPAVLSRRDYVQFVGRIPELNELLNQLSGTTPLIVVLGIGGVGKTSTCVEAALRSYRAGLFDEVIYASAKRGYLLREQAALNPSPLFRLNELLVLVLTALGIEMNPKDGTADLKRKALAALAEQQTLILLDNFETFQDQAETADFFWQVPPTTKVLVSSRIPPPTGGRFFYLKELGMEEISEIVRNECALKGKPGLIPVDNPAIQTAIYNAIGGIPLAAKLLVGMMIVQWKGLESALQIFSTRDKNTLVDFCFGEIYNSVLDEDAKVLLKTMSMAPPEATLPELEAASGLSGTKLTDSLIALEMTSLVSRGTSTEGVDAYRMLPLTRTFARSKLLETPGLERSVRRRQQEYADRSRGVGPEGTPSYQEAFRLANVARIRLKAGAVQEAIENCKIALATNDRVALVYLVYGMTEESRANFEESERILEEGHRLFRADQHITHKLAMVKTKLGKFEESSGLYSSILVKRPTSEGEIVQLNFALGGLAANLAGWVRALRAQGKFRDVRKHTQDFLNLVDDEIKYPGPLPPETDFLVKVARYNLGRELSIAGEFELAEKYLIGAFIERLTSPRHEIHNGSVFRALDINLEKWDPVGAAEKRKAYTRLAGLA